MCRYWSKYNDHVIIFYKPFSSTESYMREFSTLNSVMISHVLQYNGKKTSMHPKEVQKKLKKNSRRVTYERYICFTVHAQNKRETIACMKECQHFTIFVWIVCIYIYVFIAVVQYCRRSHVVWNECFLYFYAFFTSLLFCVQRYKKNDRHLRQNSYWRPFMLLSFFFIAHKNIIMFTIEIVVSFPLSLCMLHFYGSDWI